MADGNLETSGVKLVAEGADKYASDMDKVAKANEKAGKSLGNLASGAGGANLDKIASSATTATSAVSGLGSAGSAAGSGVAAGMAVASAALVGLIAVAGAVVAAIAAIGNAVSNAVAYGSKISAIQDASGLSGSLAQSLSGGADIGGNSARSLVGTFNAIGDAAEKSGEKAEKALGGVGAAADKTNTKLQRLNDDYARGIADITTSAAERIQESNDRLVESHAAMLERRARADEDYAREVADGRASLAQRLADIDASANTSIAALTERQSRATEDYARETENARQDLAQSILDIETDLASSIEALQYRAAETNTNAIDSGAKAQEKIQEDLQKKLYDIEQKYSSKRQSLQEKIYDPNTNPILRAFYKTQLKSLDGLQKAEVDGARAGASAKEAAARRETEALLAETARRLARETALEQQQAQRRIAAQQREATQRQAERLREFTQQSGDLAAQVGRENSQRDQQRARAISDQAARENDLRRSYERQNADAKAAYDKQVLDAAAAQLKIQAETEKRLAAEKRQYDRALEDIATSLANVGGGGASAAAAGIDKVKRGFDTLGISAAEFAKLSPDEQFKLINDRIAEMVNSGNFEGAIQLVQDLTGVRREEAVQYVRNVADMKEADKLLKDLGFTQEQIDQAKETEKGFNTVKLAIGLLGAQIGAQFLPIVLELIRQLKLFWETHGPAVVKAIKDIGKWIISDAIPAIINMSGKVVEFVKGFTEGAKSVDEKCRAISKAISQTGIDIHNVAVGIYDSLFNFGVKIFDVVKTKIDEVIRFIGTLKTKIDEFISSLGRIQLPSWLQPNGTGLTANVNFPPPPTFYGLPPSSPFGTRSQSVPATGAQMAAGNVTSNKTTTNNAPVINVVINGKADRAAVSGGISDGLFKAGFAVTK